MSPLQLTRRETLRSMLAGTAMLPLVGTSAAQAAPAGDKKRILFFTKSSGFEHSVVRRKGNALAYAEQIMVDLGKQHGFEVEPTKDGRIFDGDLSSYAAFFFYTTGDLTQRGKDGQPPMSAKGKRALLEAVHNGKGFLGSHCASDTFHSPGDRNRNQPLEKRDPYIRMLGGEFIVHGRQQKTRMTVVDPKFPGCGPAGSGFEMLEEWYALKNFAPDLHVILLNETKGMEGKMYHRPPYPATWARKHGQGRVFFTSMGHREDVWTKPVFQSLVLGGLRWATGQVEADITPNLQNVAPGASDLPS